MTNPGFIKFSYGTTDRISNLELEIEELKREIKQLKDELYTVVFNEEEFAKDK